MKTSLLIIFVIALTTLPRAPAARTTQGEPKHFSKDGLSFGYPADWTLTDNSNAQLQSLLLRREGVSTVIAVNAQREPFTTRAQLVESRGTVTAPYVANVARQLGLAQTPRQDEARCVTAGAGLALGFQMSGRLGDEPTSAEVYRLVSGQRLIHLAHIRNDKDEAQSARAWKTLLDTLKVEPPPPPPGPTPGTVEEIITGGVLNNKAVEKPPPRPYPSEAKRAGAQGTVVVEVVVDELGNVVQAKAVSGNVLLRGVSEKAARGAKFDPLTLCGRQVKGVLSYNFVLQSRL